VTAPRLRPVSLITGQLSVQQRPLCVTGRSQVKAGIDILPILFGCASGGMAISSWLSGGEWILIRSLTAGYWDRLANSISLEPGPKVKGAFGQIA